VINAPKRANSYAGDRRQRTATLRSKGSVNEISLPNTGMVRIRDVINQRRRQRLRELAGGTTTALMLHGSANSIADRVRSRMEMGTAGSEWIVRTPPRTIKFALARIRKSLELPSAARNAAAISNERMGVEEVIRKSFLDARDYTRSGTTTTRARSAARIRFRRGAIC